MYISIYKCTYEVFFISEGKICHRSGIEIDENLLEFLLEVSFFIAEHNIKDIPP